MVILLATLVLFTICANATESFSNKSSVECGGLFLLHASDKHFALKRCGISDTLTTNNSTFYGGFYHYDIRGRYTEKWELIGTNKQDVGSVGFEGRFSFATFEVEANSLPFINSKIDVHHPDSLFFLGASIAHGDPEIGNIRWLSENENDFVHEISVDWQTHFLYKQFALGTKFADNQFGIFAGAFETSPENPEKEYYIRDSVQAYIFGGNYGISFAKDTLHAFYAFVNADIYLYGIMQQDASRKRFLYIPLEMQIHYADASWKRKNLQASLNFIYAKGQIEENPDRFFETLAPNRALPTSVLKALSFSFLQKNFRVDADLDILGIFGDIAYQKTFGHKIAFTPQIALDGYYAHGEISLVKKIETKVVIQTKSYYEDHKREITSFGSFLTLGFELSLGSHFALNYKASQIIPFYIDYIDKHPEIESSNPNKSENSLSHIFQALQPDNKKHQPTETTSGDVPNKASAAFRNGFATNFSLVYRM